MDEFGSVVTSGLNLRSEPVDVTGEKTGRNVLMYPAEPARVFLRRGACTGHTRDGKTKESTDLNHMPQALARP